MNKPACLLSLPILACLGSSAFADMGRMMLSDAKVQVEETSQKAVILHNRSEELLILGTEIGATAATPIIRFIPFPAAPQVSAAPADTFDHVKAIVDKYRLSFVTRWMTKGGGSDKTQGVDVVAAARVGSHDVTTIHVSDVAAFRSWVNGYFRAHGLPTAAAYPREEAIVSDYVRRGYSYFVLDRVDVAAKVRFVEPLAFRFASANLYYPLLTSNSFGGKGTIDLFVAASVTLCLPGSNDPIDAFRGGDVDLTADPAGHGKCLGQDFKASNSVALAPQENDLGPIFPGLAEVFRRRANLLPGLASDGRFQIRRRRRRPVARRGARSQGQDGEPANSPRPGRAGASGRLPGQAGHGVLQGGVRGLLVRRQGWRLQDISVGRLRRPAAIRYAERLPARLPG